MFSPARTAPARGAEVAGAPGDGVILVVSRSVSTRGFDRTVGEDFIAGLPSGPGVYRFLDRDEVVIYVGKAKNLRRRLQSYRNASRKRAHRKMLKLVREAHAVTWEALPTEEAALLRENELIKELRPRFNVEGAFDFLYPALGIGRHEHLTLLCFTTAPEAYDGLELAWFGCFRSRLRTREAFDALLELLELLGHLEKSRALPHHPRLKGSRLVGFRQAPRQVVDQIPQFLAGREESLLGALALALLSKPRARRNAGEVQARLELLKQFHLRDAVPLRRALQNAGRAGTLVAQDERDALFIRLACATDADTTGEAKAR